MSGSLIVCIENDAAILDGMRTLLTAWDAEVIAVTDPEAAIEAIEAAGKPVTGLLVDYHLDRGNGIAAIRDIRRRFGEGIPAILITADRSPHVRAAAREEKRRGAQQAGQTGVAAGAARPVADPADDGGGIGPSLRGANGSRECAPDDRLRDEAIHLSSRAARWIASLTLAMTN